HPGLGRLLGDGLVGEDVDPHLPAPADVPGDGDTRRLDLSVGDPAGLEGEQPVVAEVHVRAALGLATAAAAVLLAVLDPLGNEHLPAPSRARTPSARPSGSRGPPAARPRGPSG